MATDVILPKVDMDMSTGVISKWHVKDGDSVTKGQAVFDIETDKAAMEIESPAAGIIRIRWAETGVSLPIGTVLAVVFAPGENQDLAVAAAAAPEQVRLVPAAKVVQAGAVAAPVPAVAAASGDGKARATPLAKRLARQNGLSLSSIAGSGPRGRVVAADVASALKQPAAGTMPAPAGAAPGLAITRFDGMRRTIALRLTQSKQTVPHFYLQATCTVDTLLQIRERLNAALAKAGKGKLSINDFIIKAYGQALQMVPEANVTFVDDGVAQHVSSDIGVAVSVDGGLFTPVIRNVEAKSLSQISAEMKDLAARARERKLVPSEYQGGSASISNLGMYGVENFAAIINPPQATILAVGGVVERFVPVNRQPVLMSQMSMTLSCDHRIIDGALGARLLGAIRGFIEDPAMMMA